MNDLESLFVVFFYVIMFVVFFYFIIRVSSKSTSKDLSESEENLEDISQVRYVAKRFLTYYEYNFMIKFADLEDELHINIVPQVNLASIIEKRSDSPFNTELFRNIDFGIFNADYSKVLLLIELNDASHNDYRRRKRDIKVKDICSKANIKLITFYTKYPNEAEYVKNRIIEALNEVED